MAIPNWPSGLPPLAVERGTSTDALYQPNIETEMEDGTIRSRRTSSVKVVVRKISMRLTRPQFAIFYPFLIDTLVSGTLPFTAPVRTSTGVLGNRRCRIKGGVQEIDDGATSVVAFQLAVYDW